MTKLEKDIRLLDKCIEHWCDNVILVRVRDLPDLNRDSCALCREYWTEEYSDYTKTCKGCPIKEKMDLGHCQNTPYEQVQSLKTSIESEPEDTEENESLWKDINKACDDEISFLENLRDKLTRKLGND